MASESAVLLPVRLETRFDQPADAAGTRLRVLVVPDVCWYDRHQPPSQGELDLLAEATDAAGGPLVTGGPLSAVAAAAFEGLARQVGPGRALWLARTFAAGPPAAEDIRSVASATRVHGLPGELRLYALVGGPDADSSGQAPILLGTSTPVPGFTISPPRPDGGAPEDEADDWWPSWGSLDKAGLTFTADLGDTPVGPIEAGEIAVLYVVGLGETDASELVLPHLESGDLGLVQPGQPTNTVAGAPAADLGLDPAAWRALGERSASAEERDVSRALIGDPAALGPLVGSSDGLTDPAASVLVPLLWGALAGTTLDDTWRLPDQGLLDACDWATKWLRPDGPLPSLRLREQPYGLWPVSEWSRWRPGESPDGAVRGEPDVQAAARVRDAMASRARSGLGTVVGADDQGLWELLAQTPTSNDYEVRAALHLETILQLFGGPQADSVRRWWETVESLAKPVAGRAPRDPVLTLGGPVPLGLGLVLPEPVFDGMGNRLAFLPALDTDPGEAEKWLADAPGLWVAEMARGFRRLFQEPGILPDLWERMTFPVDWWPASLLWRLTVVSGFVALDHAVRATNPAYVAADVLALRVRPGIAGGGPAVEAYERFLKALDRLADFAENAEPAGLIAALERVMRGLLDTASHRVDPWLTGAAWTRLRTTAGPRPVGLYGWVDRPATGDPGPDTETGVLLAPSDGQARTAVILRDKSRSDPDDRWHLDLTSASVRDASRLGDDIRAGAHPAEALGREVERLVGVRTKVDELRKAFPVREEHAGRRTCDGLAVLAAAVAAPPDPRLAACGLDAADVAVVAAIATTVDAYADLLVADAVQHALAGRAESASKALEAAAGFGMPPPLDVLRTPASGRSLRTTVVATLPAVPAPAAAERSPAVLASPALAAWLAAATGDADGPSWTWQVLGEEGVAAITLADLGLVAADTLVIHEAILGDMAAAAASHDDAALSVDPPRGPAEVRRLASTLSARVPLGTDLGVAPALAAGLDDAYRTELAARLALLRAAADDLLARLAAAATDAERVAALTEALRWGVLPGAGDVGDRVTAAIDTLHGRLDRLPGAVADRAVGDVARLVTELAAPDAAIPMFLTTTVETVSGAVGALTDEPAGPAGRPRLDASWLEIVAAVRPPLARIDAHQALAAALGTASLVAATTHPADPWLTLVPAPAPAEDVPHLLVAYGPDPLPAVGDVAIGVLDTWAEVIPSQTHTAGAAFRFNAPGARAPQALLLAVTPVIGEALTPESTLAIIAEARRTAHARMARPEDLANLDMLAGGLLPAFEEAGFLRGVPASKADWP